jgi:hypothetical protein
MKTLLVLLVLGVGGFLAYRYFVQPAEGRSCRRLADLCGEKASGVDKCARDVAELGKTSKEAVERFDTCVAQAKSCGEGAGCLVGAGFGAASHMLNDFLKGVGKALEKK